jgi:hypothetical protein
MALYRVRIPVESRPADDSRKWRDDGFVVEVEAPDEIAAVELLGKSLRFAMGSYLGTLARLGVGVPR